MTDAQNTPTGPIGAARRAAHLTRENLLIAALLALTLLAAAYLRFVGQNWDEYTHLHPDERFLTQVASALGTATLFSTDPETPGYFDTDRSQLNPNNVGFGFYVYGTLPLFIVKGAASIVAALTGDPVHIGYSGVHLIGRSVSAAADLITILFTFLIGRQLFNKWAGLLAAMFYAGAVLPIQLSHFFTVDAFTTLTVTATMWFAVRVLDGDRWYDYAGFGVLFGAAVASRVNVVPLAGVLVLAALVRVLPVLEVGIAPGERQRILVRGFGLLVLAGVISVVVFRVAMPYAFAGPNLYNVSINPSWMNQMQTVAAQVSGQADFPPNHQWASRTPYLFALENIVVWGLGVPLGVMAWLGWAWGVWRVIRGRPGWTRPLLPAAWILIYFGWQGRQWVMSMRYYVILYPLLCVLAAWILLEMLKAARRLGQGQGVALLLQRSSTRRVAVAGAAALLALTLGYTALYAYGFTGIYRRTFTRVAASEWFRDNVPGDVGFYIEGADGARKLVSLAFPNSPWQTGDDEVIDTDAEFVASASRFDNTQPYPVGFTAPTGGVVTSVIVPHLGDPLRDPGAETFRVSIANDPAGTEVLGAGQITADFGAPAYPLGDAVEIALEEPVQLEAGGYYYLVVQALGGQPITTAGAVIADEGPWDDPVPHKVDSWDGFGMGYYQSLRMHMAYEDVEFKRELMLYNLDRADYITISSNRFYDSLARNPLRWPMSIRYYQALFSGELGYELVRAFYSFPGVGPIELYDRFAEEAFHVYDHPIVLVFRRAENYDPARARAILESINLDEVAANGRPRADAASKSPTLLQLPEQMWQQQTAGGTWSERFDAEGPLSTSDLFAVLAWWALVLVLGWAAWPVLFAALPALADKAYPLAKVLGLVVIGWLPWALTGLGLPLWNQAGVTLAFVALALFSMALLVYRHQAITAYVRTRWRWLLVFELITFGLYLFWVYIRMNNPDLWHNITGGEKPMDFAYFNAVLRSTTFPPLDPWFAGGYINYYYFGYVIVGAPVLLLGVTPAVAYNLIIPMLYALTGIGAFSVAFNLAAGLRARVPKDGMNRWVSRHTSPWAAGAAALILAVVLGNLDTPRVLAGGLAKTGGWDVYTQPSPAFAQITEGINRVLSGAPLMVAPHHWYWQPSRVLESFHGNAINEFPYFTFLYADLHAHMIAMPMTLLVMAWAVDQIQGAEQKRGWFFNGLALALGALMVGLLNPTNHWDWITYILAAVLVLSFANLLRFLRDIRCSLWAWLGARWWHAGLIGLPGLYVLGMAALTLVSNNPVTWITYALAGAVLLAALSFARLEAPVKRFAVRWTGEVLAFFGMMMLAALPFDEWFDTAYSSVQFYQSGDVTPLWAYLDMHGIFLFLVASLLVWETGVWLARTKVGALRGKFWLVMAVIGLVAGALLVAIFLAFAGIETPDRGIDPDTGAYYRHHYQSLLASVPLLLWAVLLFFRSGQGREKQMVLAAMALALAITIGVEFLVLVGDIGRQNTIFKFYIQVWLLFSVAGGTAVTWLLRASDRWHAAPRFVWTLLLALLVTVGALFPITATRGKFTDRFSHDAPKTLDGMAYMQYTVHGENGQYFSLREDYDAIRWMQDNIQGTPVILEAHLGEYHWGARVSIYTGMPTVLGWNHHQRQQRSIVPQSWIWDRATDVGTMYNSTDINQVWLMLHRYDVSYIVIGETERATYDPAGLAKFQAMAEANLLARVYASESGNTVIYAVGG
ncbi:MAG: glycosyltransferase family 39 protein [Anaerolineae bacterium]|nr:glycosyltransferase family 39 protein [Anaerolineae bacterium]